jgi:hypothetical protein
VAWSPPTRACDTERIAVGVAAVPVTPEAPLPGTRTGWRYLRPFLRAFLLIEVEV